MKRIHILVLSVGIAVAQAALADGPGISPQALGTAEAVLNYCVKADSKAAGKYEERIKQLAQLSTPEALTAARKSDEYKEAYDSAVDSVGKLDPNKSPQACAQYLGPN
jgi:hypothetical protein